MPASHARPHPSTQFGRPRLHLRRKKAVELSEVLLREVQVESPRSLLPSDGDLVPGGMGRSHFGDQEYVVAATIQRVADQLLGRAVAVHLARLDQGHAEIEPELERRHFGIPVLGILAQACGPLPEHRNRLAEWKLEPPDGRGRHAASFLWTQHAACVRVRPTGKALSPARKVAQTRPRRSSWACGQVLSQYPALRRGRSCRRFRRRSYAWPGRAAT